MELTRISHVKNENPMSEPMKVTLGGFSWVTRCLEIFMECIHWP